MQFRPSPADEIALKHFADTPAGEAFRRQFDDDIAAPATAPASVAVPGAAAAPVAPPEEPPQSGDGPKAAFRPLKWLRGCTDGDSGAAAKPAELEDVQWPGKGAAAVYELPVFFVPGVSLSLPLQVRCSQCPVAIQAAFC